MHLTFVVPAMHCPSCVAFLDAMLKEFSITNAAISFIDHTISFGLPKYFKQQDAIAFLRRILKRFRVEGYQPESIEVRQNGSEDASTIQRALAEFDRELARRDTSWRIAEWLWQPHKNIKEVEIRRKKHEEICKSCRENQAISTPTKGWRVNLTVGGMTCASCVQTIESIVKSLDVNVQTFSLDLISSSARAIVSSPEIAEILAAAINDAGYEAEILQVESLGFDLPQMYHAEFALGGMTCISCVGALETAVKVAWKSSHSVPMSSFKIVLLNGLATAVFETSSSEQATSAAKRVIQIIEDTGYTAELLKVEPHTVRTTQKLSRLVEIRVDGMFCNNCPDKVRKFFLGRPDVFQVEPTEWTQFSLERPRLAFTYSPSTSTNPPITIRSILENIRELDSSFAISMISPPSLSSRSAHLAKRELQEYIIRFAIATVFVVPVLLLGVITPSLLRENHPLRMKVENPLWGGASIGEVVLWILATPVQFGVGSIFYSRAYHNLRNVWRPGRRWTDRLMRWGSMDTLIASGTSIAYFSSFAFLILNVSRGSQDGMADKSMTSFDASVFLFFFILLGRVIESWSKRKTGDAVAALGGLRPSTGLLVMDRATPLSSITQSYPVHLFEIGDIVLIPSGASPPLDCTFIASPSVPKCSFNESSLSGESKPTTKQDGDQLFAGTVNASPYPVAGSVTALTGFNLLDNILDIVHSASGRKASIERLADSITAYFVPGIFMISLIVFAVWTILLYTGAISSDWFASHNSHPSDPGAKILWALQFAISCLVVACPCGIGLAAPTAQMVGIGLASKHGILVNGGGEAFNAASRAGKQRTVFVFDKTGTITRGEEAEVVDYRAYETEFDNSLDENALWTAIDLAEMGSTHPIGAALRRHSASQVTLNTSDTNVGTQLRELKEISGKGLVATIETSAREELVELYIGNKTLLDFAGCQHFHPDLEATVLKWQESAKSVVFIATRAMRGEAVVRAAVAIADPIRTEAQKTIQLLRSQYKAEVWIISGDAETTARAVAREVGVDEKRVVAGVLPSGKQEWIERIRQGGEPVGNKSSDSGMVAPLIIFVGDGINDAPALTSADVGIALGSGSAIASSSADFILLSATSPLASIPALLSLSRATTLKIYSNFVWASIFNFALIPIAAGILTPVGFVLGPSWSGLAMALSSTTVVLNALTLKLWRASG